MLDWKGQDLLIEIQQTKEMAKRSQLDLKIHPINLEALEEILNQSKNQNKWLNPPYWHDRMTKKHQKVK
jgi:hypothetical protein